LSLTLRTGFRPPLERGPTLEAVVMQMSHKARVMVWTRSLCALCAVLLAAFGCALPASFDVSGGWAGTLTYTSGPMASLTSSLYFNLTTDAGSLSGTGNFPGAGGRTFSLPITQGEVHADTIVFTAAGQNADITPPSSETFSFDGEVTATAMAGVGTRVVNGTACNFTWQATLVAPPSADS
jgi:hypothetical protein